MFCEDVDQQTAFRLDVIELRRHSPKTSNNFYKSRTDRRRRGRVVTCHPGYASATDNENQHTSLYNYYYRLCTYYTWA